MLKLITPYFEIWFQIGIVACSAVKNIQSRRDILFHHESVATCPWGIFPRNPSSEMTRLVQAAVTEIRPAEDPQNHHEIKTISTSKQHMNSPKADCRCPLPTDGVVNSEVARY